MNNKISKKVLYTILFYVVAAMLVVILEKIFPSGPHTPGLGVLSMIPIFCISVILLLISVVKMLDGDKTYNIPAVIHFLSILSFILMLLA